MFGRRFERPFHGIRVWAQQTEADQQSTDRERAQRAAGRYAPRLRPGQFFTHDLALVLHGAPAPDGWIPTVHVAAYRPAIGPRTTGMIGHRLQAREPAHSVLFGIPVESAARAWVQTSRLWADDDLIAAADFLIARRRPLATIEELRVEAVDRRGAALNDVLAASRDGSESPKETRLRLLTVRAGLPEPSLNLTVRDDAGRFVARLDQAHERYRVAVEYDGRIHAASPRQFERDADRWDAIRALGWDHVRILRHHLAGDGAVAVERIRAALQRAGWRP